MLVTDGGYGGGDNTALAAEKNIQLVTTALIGEGAPDALAGFEYNGDDTKVLKCVAGYAPKSCSYTTTRNSAMYLLSWNIARTAHTKISAAQSSKRRLLHSPHCRMHQTERKPSGSCRRMHSAVTQKSGTALKRCRQICAGTIIWKNCRGSGQLCQKSDINLKAGNYGSCIYHLSF